MQYEKHASRKIARTFLPDFKELLKSASNFPQTKKTPPPPSPPPKKKKGRVLCFIESPLKMSPFRSQDI